jgi:hypothetical protein
MLLAMDLSFIPFILGGTFLLYLICSVLFYCSDAEAYQMQFLHLMRDHMIFILHFITYN